MLWKESSSLDLSRGWKLEQKLLPTLTFGYLQSEPWEESRWQTTPVTGWPDTGVSVFWSNILFFKSQIRYILKFTIEVYMHFLQNYENGKKDTLHISIYNECSI